MKDISYEILDLFKTYGSTREGMDQALDQDERPRCFMRFRLSGKTFWNGWI